MFLYYAAEQGIPVEEGGFACVTEWFMRENDDTAGDASVLDEFSAEEPGNVGRMYRVMAGGAEVFLQVADDTTAVQFVVLLDYGLSMTDAITDALCYYFPLVTRACIYASEVDVTETKIEQIQKELFPDITRLFQNKIETETTAASDTVWYSFHSHDFSFTGEYSITVCGVWEKANI